MVLQTKVLAIQVWPSEFDPRKHVKVEGEKADCAMLSSGTHVHYDIHALFTSCTHNNKNVKFTGKLYVHIQMNKSCPLTLNIQS